MTGKPNRNTPKDLKSLARGYTDVAIRALGTIAENGTNESSRVAASVALLDRGWNKPAQSIEHVGKDGSSGIEVTIRTILEGKK